MKLFKKKMEQAIPRKDDEQVNHPVHYNQYPIEIIDMMIIMFGKEATFHFCLLNAFKYRMRAGNKLNLEEDLAKEEFGKHNLLYVLAYIYFCIPGIRARYYSGWILSYSTLIFSFLFSILFS